MSSLLLSFYMFPIMHSTVIILSTTLEKLLFLWALPFSGDLFYFKGDGMNKEEMFRIFLYIKL